MNSAGPNADRVTQSKQQSTGERREHDEAIGLVGPIVAIDAEREALDAKWKADLMGRSSTPCIIMI